MSAIERPLKVLIGMALVLVLLTALGCSSPPEKLTIADGSQPVFALVYIADAKGFLKEAGLDVTFQSYTTGRDALASVLGGKADLATAYETPVVIQICEGKSVGIISTLHASTRNTALVARADRGISTPADLKGKRVGVTRGTNAEYFLSVFFATESLPPGSVTVVYVEQANYERALLEGEVDALAMFSLDRLRIRKLLGERAVVFNSNAYVEMSMLVGASATVAARPEAMARLMKAIVKAQDYVELNREESIRIVATRLSGKIDEALIRDGWDEFNAVAKLNHVLLSIMTLEAQWLTDTGKFTGSVPDVGKTIVAGPLRGARPEAVTLLAPTESR